jgi:hypothetical protein
VNAKSLSVWIECQRILVDVEGMKAENQQRILLGHSLAYTEDAFQKKSVELNQSGNWLMELMRDGAAE